MPRRRRYPTTPAESFRNTGFAASLISSSSSTPGGRDEVVVATVRAEELTLAGLHRDRTTCPAFSRSNVGTAMPWAVRCSTSQAEPNLSIEFERPPFPVVAEPHGLIDVGNRGCRLRHQRRGIGDASAPARGMHRCRLCLVPTAALADLALPPRFPAESVAVPADVLPD